MLKELRVDAAAPWKRRYRLPITYAVQVAALMPTRGLAVSNKSGVYQLYAWHVPTGELTQLTNREEGVVRSSLSPDGANVYYLQDRKGDEFGHILPAPFDLFFPDDIPHHLPPSPNPSFSFNPT